MIEDELIRIAAELDEVKSSPLEYLDEMERNYYDYTEDELENERASICLQLGIPRFC